MEEGFMSATEYLKGLAVRLVFFSSLAAGQIITPPASGVVQGPDSTGKCWVTVVRSYQELSFVEKVAFRAACRKNPNACDTSLFGPKKGFVACPVPPKPASPQSKPAPAVPAAATKEICPEGMQLGADENGKHLCSDGVHTSEPKKFTPLPPSTPAPVNALPAPGAR
jgi:hypothetical protein